MDIAPVRAVVFDLGNTLWFQAGAPDLERVLGLQAAAVAPLLANWGLRVETDLFAEIWQAYDDLSRAEIARGTLREPRLPDLIRGALARRGMTMLRDQAEAWHRAAWISEAEFGLQLYPDVIDVLRELQELGVKIGIDSNRPCRGEMTLPGLRDLGIASYVDVVVCSGDTGFVKPHPSTFELVLDRLGVSAGEAVMVGDSARLDMRGARAVGMRSVWKLNGRYDLPPCADADFAIHDLGELLSLPIVPRWARPLGRVESLTPHEDGNEDRY